MIRFVESIARTNKLFCSDCKKRIKQNDYVLFALEDEDNDEGKVKMEDAFCKECSEKYSHEIEVDDHPFSSEALGQD